MKLRELHEGEIRERPEQVETSRIYAPPGRPHEGKWR